MRWSQDALVGEGLSIDGAALRSSLNEKTIRRAIADGRLQARKIGRRTVILSEDLHSFLRELPAARQQVAA